MDAKFISCWHSAEQSMTMSEEKRENTQAEQPIENAQDESASAGNVDRIREILFGGRMREYEQRFSDVEERLRLESHRLRDDVEKRLVNLEGFVHKELEQLTEKHRHEKKHMAEEMKNIENSIIQLDKDLAMRISDLDDRFSKANMEIRDHLHEQGKELMETLRRRYDELATSSDRATRRLHDDKASREELSDLFTELALRLRREFDIPDSS